MNKLTVKNEIFDLLPINLKSYGLIEGLQINSNKYIEDKIIDWVHRSQITKRISKKLEEMIKNKTIIIGYLENKPMRWVWHKFKNWMHRITLGNDNIGVVNGFFSPEDKKIAIILDHNVSLMGRVLREIPPKMIHELIHYLADDDILNFTKMTLNDFTVPFYKNLIINATDKKVNPKDIDVKSLILKLALNNEGINVLSPKIRESITYWVRLFDKYLDREEALLYAGKLSYPYLSFITNKLRKKYFDDSLIMMGHYYEAYKAIDIDATELTIPGQEFKFPSEVLCVSNEFELHPKLIRMVNNL